MNEMKCNIGEVLTCFPDYGSSCGEMEGGWGYEPPRRRLGRWAVGCTSWRQRPQTDLKHTEHDMTANCCNTANQLQLVCVMTSQVTEGQGVRTIVNGPQSK